MVELLVPRQRVAVRSSTPPDNGEPVSSVRPIGQRLSHWRKQFLQGTDPNLARVSFEAYYFDGAPSGPSASVY